MRGVFANWVLSGIVTAQTGDPLTILSGFGAGSDRSGTGLGRDRADYLGGTPYLSGPCTAIRCLNYINTAAFAQPSAGTFGNLGKGTLRGPGLFNWDMGMSKNFAFTERCRLQFRAEFFNVFNRPQLNDPNTSRNSSTFGTITSASNFRVGQMALKLYF